MHIFAGAVWKTGSSHRIHWCGQVLMIWIIIAWYVKFILWYVIETCI